MLLKDTSNTVCVSANFTETDDYFILDNLYYDKKMFFKVEEPLPDGFEIGWVTYSDGVWTAIPKPIALEDNTDTTPTIEDVLLALAEIDAQREADKEEMALALAELSTTGGTV